MDVCELNATFVHRLNASIANIVSDAVADFSATPCLRWRAKPFMTGARLPRACLAVPAPSMMPPPPPATTAPSALSPTLPIGRSTQNGVAASLPQSSPKFTVRFAVGGTCRLEHLWPVVSQVADDVLAQAFARLQLCKCDM